MDSQFRRALRVVLVLSGLFALSAVAQTDDLHSDAGLSAPVVYVEELDLETPPTDRYGNPVIRSVTQWRPMCGSAAGGLSLEQLKDIAEEHRAQFGAAGQQRVAQGNAFNLILNTTPAVPAEAEAALQNVEAVLEQAFGDNVTIAISIDWANLGGGVLGATGSSQSTLSYSSVRDSLLDDMDLNDQIQEFLPGGNSIPVRYNASSETVTNENQMVIAWGNLRAIGGNTSQTVAGMTFNSSFAWDFDPSNGISGGTWDFQSVAAHEIGHAMGFISEVDDPGDGMAVLDMFRFRNTDGCCDYDPDTLAEFTTTPRMVDHNAPNDSHTFDIIEVEHRLSDGSPYQASHFREQSPPIGVMDPAIGSGQSFAPLFFQNSDLDVFDALGWDVPVELQFAAIPFFDDFPEVELNQELWLGVEGAEGSTRGANEPSPTLSLNLDANPPGGEEVRSAFMDLTSVTDPVLNYWFQQTGTDDPPENGDDLIFEYLASDGETWVELNRHFGSDPDMSEFELVTISLPAGAVHGAFRLRIRNLTDDSGSDDDWFIDDLCIDADGDGNGLCDSTDVCPEGDADGDGVCDPSDVCPGGDDTVDTDGDNVPNDCDPCPNDNPDDTDGDGVCDSSDVCPGGDDTVDTDGDNVPNDCDPCPNDNPDDTDGDGVCDSSDVCPGGDDTVDTDGDNVPNDCDPCPDDNPDDTDGDGVCDSSDVCPGGDDTVDTDGDNVPNDCDPCPDDNPDDTDGDGVCDSSDVCPGGDDTVDTDGDNVPNDCDPCPNDNPDDTDGDGVCDSSDVCPGGDDTVDTDGDNVPNDCDPCPNDNPDDTDGDGVCDSSDVCPGGDDTVDTDGDNVPNDCDPCPDDNPDDTDGDGVCDSSDVCPGGDDTVDTDGDNVPNDCDPCPDDNPDDTDGDGVCDSADVCPGEDDMIDTDQDTVPDGCDVCPGGDDTIDTDGDGIPDDCECTVYDVSGNDSVDIEDLLIVLAAWGTDPGGPPDFNGDNTVDIEDLLDLLANWGPC